MKPSLHLFHLIRSLLPAERRSFVQLAQKRKKGGKSQYLQLFLAIEKQAEYDEDALKTRFRGTSFEKSLAFPKSHLYDQVLQTLQQYHFEKTVSARFRSQLDKIELLAARSLPDQALRILEKSLNPALEQEAPFQVLQLLRWKRRLIARLQGKDFLESLNQITEMEGSWEKRLLLEQQAISIHDELYARVQAVRRKAQPGLSAETQALKQRLDTLITQPELSFTSKIACYRGYAHYSHMMEDFDAVHTAYCQEMDIWESNPIQQAADPIRYIKAFGLWLNSKALIRDHESLMRELKRLRNQQNMGDREQAEIFQITYNLELFYHLNAGQPAAAIPLGPAVSEGLNTFSHFLSPSAKLGFYYNLALVHWLGHQPEGALKWVNRILQFETGSIRKDIRHFAPMLEKILHYELGNADMLESWYRAFHYRKRKQGETDALEKLLLELIRALGQEPEREDQRVLLRHFTRDLEEYAANPGVSKAGILELTFWANLKLEKG